MSYKNGANKWTEEEKKIVIKKFKEGLTPEQIKNTGKLENRSAYAIELKIYNIIYDQLQNGDTYEDLAHDYNRTKDEIKEIEKKAFKKKHEYGMSPTQYTNDGGYTLSTTTPIASDLGEFHHINRTMNTVLHFYENISRLNKLKQEKIIDEDFYNQLIKKLNKFEFDKDKIISSLDISTQNHLSNVSHNESKSQNSEKKKKEDTLNDEICPIKKNKDIKSTKKNYDSDDDATVEIEIPTTKFKKRLI